ncbi:MAG: AprI/Inh family metalloprotease inhibitor [Notoacmeibacter sp.]|nr:AprI/Inh family metalloprotease inhibitor [Notoacmeibacter sp.]
MTYFKPGLAVAMVSVLALAGCQSERFSGVNTRPAPLAPAPLTPAPTTAVDQEQLPPPSQPGANDPSQFPAAPGEENTEVKPEDEQGTQVATATPPPASSPAISKNGLVGNWKTAASGTTCQMFLTLTKYGSGSRGGTRGCSGDMANVRGWDVKGSQLVLFDESGNTIARLYSSGSEKLNGQTTSGQPVSIFR